MGGFVHKSHTLNNFWTNELQQAFLLTDLVLLIDITLPPASWFICLNESWTRVRNTNNTVVGRYHISWIVNCISFETGPDTMWRLHNSEWENWLTVDFKCSQIPIKVCLNKIWRQSSWLFLFALLMINGVFEWLFVGIEKSICIQMELWCAIPVYLYSAHHQSATAGHSGNFQQHSVLTDALTA